MVVAKNIINQVKEKMGRLVEYILLLLSVLLVVSTLTGSTNNYYNGKILTTILMDNIPVFELQYFELQYYRQKEEPIKFTDCCKFSSTFY